MEKRTKNNRQYRTVLGIAPVTKNKRIESDYYIEGYAAKFEPYVLFEYPDGTKIYEKFNREAFQNTDMSDIILQFDHEGPVYARKSNGSLIVEVDDTGIFIAADLSRTQRGKELYDDISTGMITKMSWGFRPGEYRFNKDTQTIEHLSVKKIFDVSAVSIPANEDTELHARGFSEGVIQELTQELRARNKRILDLKIKSILGEKGETHE